MPAEESIIETLPNDAAAEWLRGKARTNARVLRELLPEARARAFAVAGVEDMDRLRRIQEAAARVPEGGDWNAAREEIAEAIGGEAAEARAVNVLRTNAFQAYAAARYRSQMEDKETFPYLKYVTVGDSKVRDSHRALDGTVLRKDDPFWETHYPPWDWGCRCVAVELTEGMAREEEREGDAEVRDKEWSRQYRATHRAADEARDYQHRPGSLTMALDEVAWKKDGSLRYDRGDLRAFNAKMEKATVELADGTVETVREWMWRPVREKAEKALRDAGRADGREHAVLLDRDTGELLDEAAGTAHTVAPDWGKAAGRDVCAYHNHPNWDPTPSPADVLGAMRGNVHEVGTTTPVGGVRVAAREKNETLAGRVAEFARRLKEARTPSERRAVREEWEVFLKTRNATGVFKVEGMA